MVNTKKITQSFILIATCILLLLIPFYSLDATKTGKTQQYSQQDIIFDPDQKLEDNTKLGGYASDSGTLAAVAGEEYADGVGEVAPAGPVLIASLIINLLLGVLGVFSLMLMVYGGFIWMLARGNEDEVKKAKDIIVGTVLGLVVVLSSYSFMRFIFEAIVDVAN